MLLQDSHGRNPLRICGGPRLDAGRMPIMRPYRIPGTGLTRRTTRAPRSVVGTSDSESQRQPRTAAHLSRYRRCLAQTTWRALAAARTDEPRRDSSCPGVAILNPAAFLSSRLGVTRSYPIPPIGDRHPTLAPQDKNGHRCAAMRGRCHAITLCGGGSRCAPPLQAGHPPHRRREACQ